MFDYANELQRAMQAAGTASPFMLNASSSFSGTLNPTPFVGESRKSLHLAEDDLNQFQRSDTNNQGGHSPSKESQHMLLQEGLSKEFLASLLNVGRPPMNKTK